MDISGINSSAAIANAPVDTGDAVQLTVLKKAMTIEAQGAMQLVAAAAQVGNNFNNPPNLGKGVDTFA